MNKFQKILEKFLLFLAGFGYWLLIILIGRTLKIRVFGEEAARDLKNKDLSLIYALWHGQTLATFYHKRKSKTVLLTTKTRRGQVLNGAVIRLGFEVVGLPGFNWHKSGLLELAKLYKLIEKGYDAGFVLDGPQGPEHQVKPGVFFAAAKTKNPIIPIGVAIEKSWPLFWRWDHYLIPRPFSKVVIIYGPPFFVDENQRLNNIEALKTDFKKILDELNEKARALLKENPAK